jgi:hypothetical protein
MNFLTALSAIGTVVGFAGQQKAARAAEEAAEYNARIAAEEAVLLQRAKTAQEANLRERAKRLASTQRVATAASGIEMSGSPLQAMADTYFSLEKDVAMLQYASTIEQTAKQAEIDLTRLQGRAGASAQRINAYSSLLGGAVSTYELNRRITTGMS